MSFMTKNGRLRPKKSHSEHIHKTKFIWNIYRVKFIQIQIVPRNSRKVQMYSSVKSKSSVKPPRFIKRLIYRGCLLIQFKGDTHIHSFTTQSRQYHTSLVASIIFNNLSLHFYTYIKILYIKYYF